MEAPGADAAAEAKRAIMDRWNAYMTRVAEMDKETWMSYWTQDAWLLEPGMNLKGSDISDFADALSDGGGQMFSLDLTSHEIFVHGNVAYQIGQYDEAFQFPGEERMEVQNYFFARWVNDDGTWSHAYDGHFPGGMTALAMLAVLESEVNVWSDTVQKGMKALRAANLNRTYSAALGMMALESFRVPKAIPRRPKTGKPPGSATGMVSTDAPSVSTPS